KTPIMEVIPHTVVTKKIYSETMQNLNLCAVIERHKATGNVGVCYVKGFNLIGGAIAQTVGHDAHNITVIGDNSRDMALAVNALGKQGGMALVTNGKVECVFPLPIAGLMSDKTAEETLILHNELIAKTSILNINQEIEPFMLLSFLSLIVIPDIKITDIGLFDVTKFEFIKD
ncbi:MAG: adenine deaminase C-terminal domain-containing protein, partial [Clostridia bacterium]